MKKFIFLLAVVLASFTATAQKRTPSGTYTYIAHGYEWLRGYFQALNLPAGDVPSHTAGQWIAEGGVFVDTVDNSTPQGLYLYINDSWQLQGTGTPTANLPNTILSGGMIFYEGSGFNYGLSATTYRIDGIIYFQDSLSYTLDPADDDFTRNDVPYLDATGFHILTGEPSAASAIPQVAGDQIALTSHRVPAGATVPDFVRIIVYDENVENWLPPIYSGTTGDPDNLTAPWVGTKSIRISGVNNGDMVIFPHNASGVSVYGYTTFSFGIRLLQAIPASANVRITFYANGLPTGLERTVPLNRNSLVFQGIAMDMASFNLTNYSVDSVRFRFTNTTGTVYSGFDLDYINFFTDLTQPAPPGGSGVTRVGLTMPAGFTVSGSPVTGDGTIAVTAPGNTSQVFEGDGVARTDTRVKTIGAFDSQPSEPNGAAKVGTTVYFQSSTDSTPGMLTPFLHRVIDTLRQNTAENLSEDGDSIMVNLDAFRIGFKRLRFISGGSITATDSTLDLSAGLGSLTASQGLSKVGDDIRLGTALDAGGAPFTYHRLIDLNRKFIRFTNGYPYTDSTSERWSTYQILQIDTVKSLTVDYDSIGKALLNAKRIFRYAPGVRTITNRFGNRLAVEYQGTDSTVIRTNDGDYGSNVIHLILGSEPGYTGRVVYRAGHTGGSPVTPSEWAAALVSKVYLNVRTDSATENTNLRFIGGLKGVNSYISGGNFGKADTLDAFAFYGMGTYLNAPTRVTKMYGMYFDWNKNLSDSVYGLYDRNMNLYNYMSGYSVFGAGPQIFTYALRSNGATYLSDSVTVNTARAVDDTTGYDIVLRKRADGALLRIRADQLGVGGGGTPTIAQVLTAGNVMGSGQQLDFGSIAVAKFTDGNTGKHYFIGGQNGGIALAEEAREASAVISTALMDTGDYKIYHLPNITPDTDTLADRTWVRSLVAGGGVALEWGVISGTLADQTDLQTALDAKLAHTTANPAHEGTTPSGAGVMPAVLYTVLDSDFSLSDVNTAQTCMPTGFDTYTLQGGTTYEIEVVINVACGTASHAFGFGWSQGGAGTIASYRVSTIGWASPDNNTASVQASGRYTAIAPNTLQMAASAVAGNNVIVKGILRVASGSSITLTPQIQFSAAPGGANVVKADSFIKITPVGSHTFTTKGNPN